MSAEEAKDLSAFLELADLDMSNVHELQAHLTSKLESLEQTNIQTLVESASIKDQVMIHCADVIERLEEVVSVNAILDFFKNFASSVSLFCL